MDSAYSQSPLGSLLLLSGGVVVGIVSLMYAKWRNNDRVNFYELPDKR